MKLIRFALSTVAFISLANAQQAQQRPKYPAQLSFKVLDDSGQPVENVIVSASTFERWVPGEGFGKDISATTIATTNKDGIAVIQSQSMDGEFGISVRDKQGYYHDKGRTYRLKEIADGKWHPWNPEISIVFKPILNPVPMYAKKVGELPAAFEMPVVGKPVGFDLMRGDWVAPYGLGVTADLILLFSEEIPFQTIEKPFVATLKVHFSNPLDGIQSSFAPLHQESALRLPRFAPAKGYEPELVKRIGRMAEKSPIDTNSREDQNYFIRIRTVLDENGNIKSAHYGKISGDIRFWENRRVRFIYYLNPTPLDRNMEFDPKQNLFGNLPSSERVRTP